MTANPMYCSKPDYKSCSDIPLTLGLQASFFATMIPLSFCAFGGSKSFSLLPRVLIRVLAFPPDASIRKNKEWSGFAPDMRAISLIRAGSYVFTHSRIQYLSLTDRVYLFRHHSLMTGKCLT